RETERAKGGRARTRARTARRSRGAGRGTHRAPGHPVLSAPPRPHAPCAFAPAGGERYVADALVGLAEAARLLAVATMSSTRGFGLCLCQTSASTVGVASGRGMAVIPGTAEPNVGPAEAGAVVLAQPEAFTPSISCGLVASPPIPRQGPPPSPSSRQTSSL